MLRTPLYQFHVDHGAKMVDFAGWEMPLVYMRDGAGGITEEHLQVRRSGGLFDVSHMGRFRVSGRHSVRLLERVCTRKIRDMKPQACRYSLVCNERGGVHDDVIVMRIDEDDFIVVVNASNREKLLGHFRGVISAESLVVKLDDTTMSTAMVAVQGPKVMEMVSKFSREIPTLKRYTFAVKNLLVVKLYVSRTGYTGEDGVEVILPAAMMGMAMKMLLKDVDTRDPNALVKPAGLGARDTLRLEAGMPLYGHELNEETSALASGLDFAIALDKEPDESGRSFIGAEALRKERDSGGPARKLVGMKVDSKRSARQGMAIWSGGKQAGVVTSGAPSPTLGVPIAMGYVDRAVATPGGKVEIDTGKGERLAAEIVPLPFYKAPAPAK